MTWLGRVEEAVAAVLVAVILLVTLYAVVMRYVFDAPQSWPSEGTRLAMVFATFIGAGTLAATREWIAVDLFSGRLPLRARQWWNVAVHLVTAVILLFICAGGLTVVSETQGTTPVLGIPLSVTYGVVVVALFLTALQEIRYVVVNARGVEVDPVDPGVHLEGADVP